MVASLVTALVTSFCALLYRRVGPLSRRIEEASSHPDSHRDYLIVLPPDLPGGHPLNSSEQLPRTDHHRGMRVLRYLTRGGCSYLHTSSYRNGGSPSTADSSGPSTHRDGHLQGCRHPVLGTVGVLIRCRHLVRRLPMAGSSRLAREAVCVRWGTRCPYEHSSSNLISAIHITAEDSPRSSTDLAILGTSRGSKHRTNASF